MRRKLKPKAYKLKLKCHYCDRIFYATRYRKYCKADCRKLANAIGGRLRYQEMRDALLRSRGKIK